MRLSEVTTYAGLPIEGYGPGFFRVAGEARPAPLAVMPSGLVAWIGYGDAAALVEHAGELDILFLGTGPELARPPEAFRRAIEEAGIGLELAASSSACRSYNVLLGEGRRVGIALLPV